MRLKTSLLLMLAPVAIQAAIIIPTNGTSGPQCGTYKCLGNGRAACINGVCKCQGNTIGLGSFVCARRDQQLAATFNDPMVVGFDGSHVKVPLISQFLVAQVSTTTCTGATPDNLNIVNDGMCDVKFYGWGRRKNGKTFVRGIKIVVLVYVHNITYHHATRIDSSVFNGQYIYTEDGSANPFGAPPYGDPVITVVPDLGSIYAEYDEVDNYARIYVEPCGVEVGLRGVDQIGDSLALPAGLYMKVLTGCQPTYLSYQSSLFVPPPGLGPSLVDQVEDISNTINYNVTPFLLSVYKTLAAPTMQDFPDAPAELQILSDTINGCPVSTVYIAIYYCIFVVERPRFFNCFDNSTDANLAIGLLDQCIFSICDNNPFMCQETQLKVATSGCRFRLRPEEVSILDKNCDDL